MDRQIETKTLKEMLMQSERKTFTTRDEELSNLWRGGSCRKILIIIILFGNQIQKSPVLTAHNIRGSLECGVNPKGIRKIDPPCLPEYKVQENLFRRQQRLGLHPSSYMS